MNKCLTCGEYMRWEYSKGWYCPNGCVIKTSTSNHTELVEHPLSTWSYATNDPKNTAR